MFRTIGHYTTIKRSTIFWLVVSSLFLAVKQARVIATGSFWQLKEGDSQPIVDKSRCSTFNTVPAYGAASFKTIQAARNEWLIFSLHPDAQKFMYPSNFENGGAESLNILSTS
jgi:hypothetical protein